MWSEFSEPADDIGYTVYVEGEECLDTDPYYPDGNGWATSYAQDSYPDSMSIDSYTYLNASDRATFAADYGLSPVPLFIRENSDHVVDQWSHAYADSLSMWEEMAGDFSACLSSFDSTPESDPVPGPSWEDDFYGSGPSCYATPPTECTFEMYDTWVATNADGDYELSPDWILDYSCADIEIST
jgi:hypothetical protein